MLKHTSGLNQVETSSASSRRCCSNASLFSAKEPRDRILAFIEYFNNTLAKPFRWSYNGSPLRA